MISNLKEHPPDIFSRSKPTGQRIVPHKEDLPGHTVLKKAFSFFLFHLEGLVESRVRVQERGQDGPFGLREVAPLGLEELLHQRASRSPPPEKEKHFDQEGLPFSFRVNLTAHFFKAGKPSFDKDLKLVLVFPGHETLVKAKGPGFLRALGAFFLLGFSFLLEATFLVFLAAAAGARIVASHLFLFVKNILAYPERLPHFPGILVGLKEKAPQSLGRILGDQAIGWSPSGQGLYGLAVEFKGLFRLTPKAMVNGLEIKIVRTARIKGL